MNAILTTFALLLALSPDSDSFQTRDTARFDASGLELEAAHGATLRIGAVELRRGAHQVALAPAPPIEAGAFTLFARAPGVVERFEQRADGIEHSLELAGPIGTDGDLVVRFALGGCAATSGQRRPDGTHDFAGITYGRLVGIDANGARTDGEVRLVDGGLEWVIADAWLDAASWPIVLDPLLGWLFDVTTNNTADEWWDFEPDVAYDATFDVYLVVWERRYYDGRRIAHARRLTGSGAPFGPAFALTTVYPSFHVRVANLPDSNRFAVTWIQDFFGATQLRMVAIDALSGAFSNYLVVASGDPDVISGQDVAGDTIGGGNTPHAHAIWRSGDGIHHSRVLVPSNGNITLVGDAVIAPDPDLFMTLVEPTVSRTTSPDGRLGVAWVRSSLTGRRVQAMVIDRNSNIVNTPVTLSGADDDCELPSIDGGGSNPTRYVVSWSNHDDAASKTYVRARSAQSTTSLEFGTTQELWSALGYHETSSSIGWRPGTARVAYKNKTSVVLATLDAATAQLGASEVAMTNSADGSHWEPAICLEASGGNVDASGGILVARIHDEGFQAMGFFFEHNWLVARMVDTFGTGAGTLLLDGACGPVGNIVAPQPPALGNGTFRILLAGAPPDATVAILNIAAPQATLDCGTCRWVPLATTYILPVAGGVASRSLPVPLNASLAGVTAWAQWTVVAPSTAGCVAVPGFGTSQILELTLN